MFKYSFSTTKSTDGESVVRENLLSQYLVYCCFILNSFNNVFVIILIQKFRVEKHQELSYF
jgi:hypothetical protein